MSDFKKIREAGAAFREYREELGKAREARRKLKQEQKDQSDMKAQASSLRENTSSFRKWGAASKDAIHIIRQHRQAVNRDRKELQKSTDAVVTHEKRVGMLISGYEKMGEVIYSQWTKIGAAITSGALAMKQMNDIMGDLQKSSDIVLNTWTQQNRTVIGDLASLAADERRLFAETLPETRAQTSQFSYRGVEGRDQFSDLILGSGRFQGAGEAEAAVEAMLGVGSVTRNRYSPEELAQIFIDADKRGQSAEETERALLTLERSFSEAQNLDVNMIAIMKDKVHEYGALRTSAFVSIADTLAEAGDLSVSQQEALLEDLPQLFNALGDSEYITSTSAGSLRAALQDEATMAGVASEIGADEAKRLSMLLDTYDPNSDDPKELVRLLQGSSLLDKEIAAQLPKLLEAGGGEYGFLTSDFGVGETTANLLEQLSKQGVDVSGAFQSGTTRGMDRVTAAEAAEFKAQSTLVDLVGAGGAGFVRDTLDVDADTQRRLQEAELDFRRAVEDPRTKMLLGALGMAGAAGSLRDVSPVDVASAAAGDSAALERVNQSLYEGDGEGSDGSVSFGDGDEFGDLYLQAAQTHLEAAQMQLELSGGRSGMGAGGVLAVGAAAAGAGYLYGSDGQLPSLVADTTGVGNVRDLVPSGGMSDAELASREATIRAKAANPTEARLDKVNQATGEVLLKIPIGDILAAVESYDRNH